MAEGPPSIQPGVSPPSTQPQPQPQPQPLSLSLSLPQPPLAPGDNQAAVGTTLKRYVILLLFCLNTGNKAFQWIQIPASTTKATVFYGVDNYVINFASIIFMVCFLVVSWPACYLIQSIGIRRAILWASFGTIVGSTVKCCSCYENGVVLMLLGQLIISLSEQLVHQIPGRLASVWFPDGQVSSCVATCVLGNQLGVALGFLLPQWLLEGAQTRDQLGAKFFELFLITLVYSLILFLSNWLLFEEAPSQAPGLARQRQIAIEQLEGELKLVDASLGLAGIKRLFEQVGQLLRNRDLVLIAISFGLSYARSDAISTILDQTIGPLYPQSPKLVGQVGFLIVLAGALGLPVWGQLMDRWRHYKAINVILLSCTALTLALFVYALLCLRSEGILMLAAALFGFFQSGSFASTMDFAIELTYPAPEIITSGVMFSLPAIMGPVLVFLGSFVVDNYGALAVNLLFLATVFAGMLAVLLSRERLKRQEAISLQAREAPQK